MANEMTSAPDQGILALPENDEMARPQLSMEDSYDTIQSALGEVSPQAAQDVYGALRDSISRLPELSPEQVDTALQVLKELYNAEQDGYLRVLQRLIAEGKIAPGDFPEEYDPEFLATAMAVLMEAKKNSGEMSQTAVLEPPQGMARGGIAEAVRKASAKGRNGDTMLAHIGPEEAAILRRHGGAGTINPATGLPEFGFLSDLWKTVKGAVKDVLSSPVGRIVGTIALAYVMGPAALGWTSSTLAAMPLASGAATLLGGGNLKDALKSAAVSYLAGPTGPLAGVMGNVTQALGITNPALAQFAGSALTGAGATLLTGGKLKDAVQAGLMQGVISSAFSGPRPEGLEPVETRPTLPGLEGLPGAETLPGTAPTAGAPGPVAPVATESLVPAPMAPAAPQAPGAVPSPVTPPQEMAFRDLPGLNELPQTAPPAAQGAQPPAGPGFQAAPRPGMFGGSAPVEPPYTPGALQQDYMQSYKTPGFTESMGRAYDALKSGEFGQAGSAVKEAFMPPTLSDAELMQRPEFQQYRSSGFTAQQALDKTREAVNPGMLRRYGPMAAAGLGVMALGGGFKRPQAAQSPYQKYMSDKLERERAWLEANPGAFFLQNLPGVAYDAQGRPVLGSGMPPPGYRHGGPVHHFDAGGDVGTSGESATEPKTDATGTTPAPITGVMPPPSVVSAPIRPYMPYPQGSVVTPSVGATEQGHVDIFNQQRAYNQAIANTLGVASPFAPQMPSAIAPYAGRNVRGMLPSNWDSITDPKEKMRWLNTYNVTAQEMLDAGVPKADVEWIQANRGTVPAPLPILGAPSPVSAPVPRPIGAPPPIGAPAPIGAPPPIGAPAPAAVGFNSRAAADYIKYRKLPGTEGGSVSAIRSMLERDYGPQTQAQIDAYEKAYQEHMDYLAARPTGIGTQVAGYSPEAKAATYENYLARGWTEKEIRDEAEKQFGPQKDSDWAELQRIAKILPDDLLPKTGKVPTDIQTEKAVADWKAKQAAAPAAPAAAPTPAATEEISEGYKFATQPGGIGMAQYYENIANFLRNNPTEEEIRAAMQQYGVSDLDVRRAQIIHALPGKRFAQGGLASLMPSQMTAPTMPVQSVMPAVPLPQQYGQGGYPRRVGQISGPGTEKSDSIPAMLSDGEFVMTAKAVRGAGKGSRREGAKRMYALMHRLERNASKG